MKKVLYDQIFGATVFTFLFITIVSLLDGYKINDSIDEFFRKFPIIYLVNVCVHSLLKFKKMI